MNFALKQLLDEFRNHKNVARLARPSTENVRISEVVSNSARKNNEVQTPHFPQKSIQSEREMELKIEILNLSEKLENQTTKNIKLQAQIEELRQINEEAK